MAALRVIAFLGAALMFSAGTRGAVPADQPSEIAGMLDRYVPDAMRAAGVPGISIAVIEGGKIVLARAYGVDDVLTRRPVQPDTLFQVASNGKVATAYAALRLVDAHKLALDRPLAGYLPAPWTTAPGGDRITLRQVLSHARVFPTRSGRRTARYIRRLDVSRIRASASSICRKSSKRSAEARLTRSSAGSNFSR